MAFPTSGLFVVTFVDALDTTQLALDLDLDTHKVALYTNSVTGADLTTDTAYGTGAWASNEVANGNGYTTGGATPANVALSESSGTIKFTGDAVVWTASGGDIPAWRYGVVYYLGTLNGKVNPVVGYFLGDSTPADVPATTDGNTLTVTPHASGILSAAQA